MKLYQRWQPREPYDSYELIYPERVEFAQVVQWLGTVHPAVGREPGRRFGVRVLVLEVVIDSRGIHHRLWVPAGKADSILGQLENHIPDVHAQRSQLRGRPMWTHGREYGTTDHDALLAVEHPEAASRTILGSIKDMADGEAAMYQLVLAAAFGQATPSPAASGWPVGLLLLLARGLLRGAALTDKQAAAKGEQPNFRGIVRTAVRVRSTARAVQLLQDMQHALASLHSGRTQFRRLPMYPYILERIAGRSVPFFFPARFGMTETATLAAVPLRSPELAGLPRARTRHLRPDALIPAGGIVLARSTVPGRERLLGLRPADFCQHLYVPGKTGTGKSTVLENIAAQWMAEPRRGLALFDPHGDLALSVLNLVPRERLGDVIYMLQPAQTARLA